MKGWWVVISLVGCSAPPAKAERTPEPAPEPDRAAELCDIHCDRAETCGVFRDACERDCPARGRSLAKMRRDFVGRMMLCLEGASCAALKSSAAWKGCHDSIVKTLPVSDALRKFCFETSRKAAQCKRADDADQTACLTQFRYVNDTALTRGTQCSTDACERVPACMARAVN